MCWKCGEEIDLSKGVYRNSTCPVCGADLHCCRGCKFYSLGNHFDCRESIEDLVKEKERANFCEHFMAGKNSSSASKTDSEKNANKKQAARSAFDALFS